MKGAVITLALVALSWLAWTQSAHLADWAGFGQLDFLVQLAAVLAVLALAERLLARFVPHA